MNDRHHRLHTGAGGVLAALALALLAGTAQGQEAKGPKPYFSLSGMWVKTSDAKASARSGGVKLEYDMAMGSGVGVTAALGTAFRDGWRAEVELGYRPAGFDKMKDLMQEGENLGDFLYDGELKTFSLMGNAYLDFQVGRVKPYLGAGLGVARHKAKAGEQTLANDMWYFPRPASRVSGSDNVFAYQLMAGLSHPLTPEMDVRAGYRYFGTKDTEIAGTKGSYGSHNFEVGLVRRF